MTYSTVYYTLVACAVGAVSDSLVFLNSSAFGMTESVNDFVLS